MNMYWVKLTIIFFLSNAKICHAHDLGNNNNESVSKESNTFKYPAINSGDIELGLSKAEIETTQNLVRSSLRGIKIDGDIGSTKIPELHVIDEYDPKLTKDEKIQEEIQSIISKEQIEYELKNRAIIICQETMCGNQKCQDLVEFEYIKSETGDYFFTKIYCKATIPILPSSDLSHQSTIMGEYCENVKSNKLHSLGIEKCPSSTSWIPTIPSISGLSNAFSGAYNKYLKPLQQACTANNLSVITNDVACAMLKDITQNGSPADLFSPWVAARRIFSEAYKAALSSAVVNTINAVTPQAANTIDIDSIIKNANEHKNKGKRNKTLAVKQINIIEDLLREASGLASNYAGEKAKLLDQFGNIPAKTTQASKDENTKIVNKTYPNVKDVYFEGRWVNIEEKKDIEQARIDKAKKEEEEKQRVEQEKLAANRTNKDIFENMIKVAKGKRPERAVLEKENPRLLVLLDALNEFTKIIPVEDSIVNRETVDLNIQENPALGNPKFVQELKTWAHTLANNANVSQMEQDKKFIIAASEPGTGKTTGIKLAAQWANIPVCSITGEDFQKLKIEHDQKTKNITPAWDEYKAIISKCLLNFYITVIDEKGVEVKVKVARGVILHDDYHFALKTDASNDLGYLHPDIAPLSRVHFLNAFKNFSDYNNETIDGFSVTLAPGIIFPLYTGKTQFAMTLNEQIKELSDKDAPGMGPHQSRMLELPAGGPNENDRREFALTYIQKIKKAIQEKYGNDQVNKLDEKECHDRLLDVIEKDIQMYKKMNKTLGIRGTMSLLGGYLNHVKNKLKGPELNPKVCSFSGLPEFNVISFNIEATANTIQDYKKMVSEDMEKEEQAKKLTLEIDAFMNSVRDKLMPNELENMEHSIKQAQNMKETLIYRKLYFDEAKKYYNEFCQRIRIPSPQEIGKKLTENYSYLQTTQEIAKEIPKDQIELQGNDNNASIQNIKMEDEVNRFDQLLGLAENIYLKLMQYRGEITSDAKFSIPNNIIQVNYTHEGGRNPLFFRQFANIFGELPVMEVFNDLEMFKLPEKDLVLKTDNTEVQKINAVAQKIRKTSWDNLTFSSDYSNNSIYLKRLDLVDGRCVLYFIDYVYGKKKYHILQSDKFESIIKLIETAKQNEDIQITKEFAQANFETINEPSSNSNFEKIVNDITNIKLDIFDKYIAKFKGSKSLKEGFIVIHLNKEIIFRINYWAAHHPESNSSINYYKEPIESLDFFKKQIFKLINSDSLKMPSLDTSINPKGLTLFLNFLGDWHMKSQEGTQTITFGIPPISGRKKRAQALLQTRLAALRTTFENRHYKTEKEKEKALKSIELNGDEQNLFEIITNFDAQQAREYQSLLNKPMPITPLESSILGIIVRVQTRNNMFKINLGASSPKTMLGSSEENYNEYKEEMEKTKRKIEWQKKKDQEAKEENEKRLKKWNKMQKNMPKIPNAPPNISHHSGSETSTHAVDLFVPVVVKNKTPNRKKQVVPPANDPPVNLYD